MVSCMVRQPHICAYLLVLIFDFQTLWLLGLMFLTNGGLSYAGLCLFVIKSTFSNHGI